MAMMAQSVHAITNGITETKAPKQPVIRVPTVMVHRPVVATVVGACSARTVRVIPLLPVVGAIGADRRAGRHLVGTGSASRHICILRCAILRVLRVVAAACAVDGDAVVRSK